MIKEIKYGSYSAAPGDHDSLEGDLAVALNLIPEQGTIKPVLPPKVIAQIPGDPYLPIDKGRKIVCIHQTSAFKHFIVAIEFDGLSPQHPPYTYLYRWDGTEGSGLVRLGYKAFNEIYKVEPVGNTLVVLTDTGIHYYLWKSGAYQYLGNHLPELDLQFELTDGKEYESDEHKVEWNLTGYDDTFDDALTPISWFSMDYQASSGASNGKEEGAKLRQGIMASLNDVVADICIDKRFAFPLFVRYAFRLYDGDSITMHSAPALLVPTLNAPTLNMGWAGISYDRMSVKGPAKIKASFTGYKLHCKPLDVSQLERLAQWSDIVSSVDIFISPQFYTYNQGAKDREIIIDSELPMPPLNTRLASDIKDNGNFYLLKQIRLSKDMPQRNKLLQGEGDVIDFDFEPTNDNIVVRERMTDDYGTHDELYADKSFAYNNRLNLAGVSKRIFNGFNPACMWRKIGDTDSATTSATVVVETDGREIIVQSPSGVVYYANRSSEKVLWFYYPDPSAKRAYLNIGGNNVELELIAHPMLNGAYFCSLNEDAVQQSVDSIPTPSTPEERIVSMPNKVYTSEVNNPFYFPSTGINSIGTGNVLGICAAVRPVSTGQMGYADLYIFADSGVWVAKINDKGTYSDVTLATGDICINPDSITQMETSVLFTTDRGIMLISGSQAQCISEAIDDKGAFVPGMTGYIDRLAELNGLGVIDVRPFREFLGTNKDNGCRMIYDYRGQRIIVYNPATSPVDDGSAAVKFPYAYIYSLESHKWGMMQSDISYTVRSYPEALAVTHDGHLVNFSEHVEVMQGSALYGSQLLVTRPLTLDQPDILKTVNTVLQRGLFRKRQQHVQSALYASRDLFNWHLVSSSDNENMRGFSGTPYKWFRVALLLHLAADESVTGCSIQFQIRFNNRIR